MIKNYFKIAFRNLLNNKAVTSINIFGLSMGIAGCLLMAMYLQFELSFDEFNTKTDRIVRVIMSYSIGGEEGASGNFTSAKVFPTFKQTFPEVESGVRLSPTGRLVSYKDKVINERNFVYADSTFFDLFEFELVSGTAKTVLEKPKSVVITESMASKYFGKENPINKTLLISSNQDPYIVTGVSKDCPKNSQVRYDFVASISSFGGLPEQTYWNANYTTYLQLGKEVTLSQFQAKVDEFMKKEMPESLGATVAFNLEQFSDVHLHSPHDAIVPNSNMTYIYIVSGMAALLLLIACFTYINLSTARSVERAGEVGVRKAIGAHKSQLFWQFISESVIATSISVAVGLVLTALLIPYFNNMVNVDFNTSQLLNPQILFITFGLFLIISFCAGSYPAFVLTGFNPIDVLKGNYKSSKKGVTLGNSLTIFQFAISIFLIIATLVIKNQLDYIQNKKLGFDKDHSIMVSVDGKMSLKIDLIKSELGKIPGVVAVSNAYNSPLQIKGGYNMSGSEVSQQIPVTANPVDENFLQACNIKLIAGLDLTLQDIKNAENQEEPSYNFILNKSAAKTLGWTPDEAIGKAMYMDESRPGKVKGVVEDFHFTSLHAPIKPLVLFPSSQAGTLIIRAKNDANLENTIAQVGKKMQVLAPHRPFEYQYMDAEYRNMYASEQRTSNAFNSFGFISLLLACLGLFGLSMYATRQRNKEIGVRKVLGASITEIFVLLSSNFIKLIIIAFVITAPLAYLGANKWLETFAYRTDIGWYIFAIAGISITVISLITVSFTVIRAALVNPVESLKSE
jgi:putative ABC transport system permease protein